MVDTKRTRRWKGEVPARRRRRAHGAAFKRRIVKLTLEAGASVAAIALENGLNTNLVFKWRRDHLRRLAKASTREPVLLPVSITPVPALVESVTHEVVERPARATRTGRIELELPGGRVRLDGAVDSDTLRLVVQLLSGR